MKSRVSKISCTYRFSQRSWSRSSIRRNIFAPVFRAIAAVSAKENTLPRWRNPLGVGAIRVRLKMRSSIDAIRLKVLSHSFQFEQVRHQHLVERLIDVGFHKVDAELGAAQHQLFLIGRNGIYISLLDLIGMNLHLFTRFHVDELVGTVVKIKIQLLAFVRYMKKNNFVLVVL